MTTPIASSELADMLAERYEILDAIADSPSTQSGLSDRMDVSRPTVHRIVKAFVEFDLVHQRDEKYELTAFGRAVHQHHREYLDDLDRLCRLEAIEDELDGAVPFDSPILDGGDADINDEYAIDSAGYKNRDLIDDAIRVHTVLDAVMFDYLDAHRGDTNHEEVVMVVPDDFADSLLETYREPIEDLLGTDYFELYRTGEPVPFSVTLAENPESKHAILLSHAGGRVVGSVRNDSPEAIAWARERIDEKLDGAEQIRLDD